MDKIFTYANSTRDKNATFFRANNKSQHAELLRLILRNPISGFVFEGDYSVKVARHAAHEIAAHCIRNGWTLGV